NLNISCIVQIIVHNILIVCILFILSAYNMDFGSMETTDIQKTITSLIRQKQPENQAALQALLKKKGIEMTQSSISRFLNKAGIKKVDGQYKIPEITEGESGKLEFLRVIQA